jgi:hypothetical protein
MNHYEPYKIIKKYKTSRSGNQKLSRYRNLGVLVDSNNSHYLESPKKRVFRESPKDKIYIVESGYEDRIDMVSFKFYNTPHLWWVIAEVNHIKNPMRLEVGIALRIPPLDEISI